MTTIDEKAPAPAEVSMPEPEFVLSYDGWHRRYLLKKMPVGSIQVWGEQAVRTYGAACRAAGEAAGYARGMKEAIDRIRRGREILDAALRGEVK